METVIRRIDTHITTRLQKDDGTVLQCVYLTTDWERKLRGEDAQPISSYPVLVEKKAQNV